MSTSLSKRYLHSWPETWVLGATSACGLLRLRLRELPRYKLFHWRVLFLIWLRYDFLELTETANSRGLVLLCQIHCPT